VIAALAGRRIDAPASATPRFPLANIPLVRARLSRRLQQVRPDTLVCSAACGADLLALDIAGSMGVRRRIVLPFAAAQFRETSVIDRPGDWGGVYDRVIAEVSARGDLVVLGGNASDGDAAYRDANARILDEVRRLDDPAWMALVVWDGSRREGIDLSAEFLAEAQRLKGRVEVIRTL
jgi:hypothetical protein